MTKFKSMVLLFIFVSCAHFSTQRSHFLIFDENYQEQWIKYLKQNCLNSEGVGRLALNEESLQFNYESAFRLKKSEYLIGLEYPLIGQEVMSWDYQKKMTSGSFYQRLLSTIHPDLNPMIKEINAGIYDYLKIQNDLAGHIRTCKIVDWDKKSHQMKLDCPAKVSWLAENDQVTYQKELSSDLFLKIKLAGLNKKFMQTKFVFTHKSFWREKIFFEMDLMAHVCE